MSSETASQVKVNIARSISDLDPNWDWIDVSRDVFLSQPYMRALEQYPPYEMDFVYVVMYQDERPVGRAYFQIKHFDASEHIKTSGSEEKENCFFSALSKWTRRWLSRRVKSDILVCGNLLCTGEHHFQFESHITAQYGQYLLEKAIEAIAAEKQQKLTPFVLIKDVAISRVEEAAHLKQSYTEFQIAPNMVLDIVWPNTDAYLAAMSTKYRTRAKRARKKLGNLTLRQLDIEEQKKRQDEIYALYQQVATNVGFNMVDLNPRYLLGLQEHLGSSFSLYGYFDDDQLVAFFSLIKNEHEMEAHFIGMDSKYNHEYQLYLNILYEIVHQSIGQGVVRIIFARTASEIKSTVGAVPEQLNCYLKHTGSFTNMVTPRVIEYLKPVENWVQRHPFKDSADEPD
jgi:Acetyltransferase (GNAT) domain